MAYPDDIRCLFSTELRHVGDGSYVIDIPERELSLGSLSPHETYRVTIERLETETDLPAAPVEIGDERTVEIETIGEQAMASRVWNVGS